MTTRTTFEDRLLAELQGEIERRTAEADRRRTPHPGARPTRRLLTGRLLTGRKLALAAGACAVAALAIVLAPGTPADSPAYAVERHGDGSVTLSLLTAGIGADNQHRLAQRLRAEGIHVTIDNLPYGQRCAQPRGELLSSPMQRIHLGDKPSGDTVAAPAKLAEKWQVTLNPGDSLGIENTTRKDGKETPGELFYAIKGEISPCERAAGS
jgi:hypothetical protein